MKIRTWLGIITLS